jgi:hypothetical protein
MEQSVLALVVLSLALSTQACGSSTEGDKPHVDVANESGGAAGVVGSHAGSSGVGTAAAGKATTQGGAAQGGSAQGGAAGRAQVGVGGQSTTQVATPACVRPVGADVVARDYTLPSGCYYPSGLGAHFVMDPEDRTITDEATFAEIFQCEDGAASARLHHRAPAARRVSGTRHCDAYVHRRDGRSHSGRFEQLAFLWRSRPTFLLQSGAVAGRAEAGVANGVHEQLQLRLRRPALSSREPRARALMHLALASCSGHGSQGNVV